MLLTNAFFIVMALISLFAKNILLCLISFPLGRKYRFMDHNFRELKDMLLTSACEIMIFCSFQFKYLVRTPLNQLSLLLAVAVSGLCTTTVIHNLMKGKGYLKQSSQFQMAILVCLLFELKVVIYPFAVAFAGGRFQMVAPMACDLLLLAGTVLLRKQFSTLWWARLVTDSASFLVFEGYLLFSRAQTDGHELFTYLVIAVIMAPLLFTFALFLWELRKLGLQMARLIRKLVARRQQPLRNRQLRHWSMRKTN
jgi:hypothetical protein